MATPKLILLIGLPGSGKTTWARKMVEEKPEMVHLSSDAIRAELYGNENILGDHTKVFSLMEKRMRAALKEGRDVIYDATNINARSRTGLLNLLRTARIECEKHAILFATPYEECVARDAARDRHVGEEVIHRMMCYFQPPWFNEGWDAIYVDSRIADSSEVVFKTTELFEAAERYDQHNKHHRLSLGHHLRSAADYVLTKDGREIVYYAAMWHDIGKMDTQSFGEDGEAHYYGHEYASAYRWLTGAQFADYLRSHNIDDLTRGLFIGVVICWHMVPYKSKNNEGGFELWAKKKGFNEDEISCINAIHEADLAAH